MKNFEVKNGEDLKFTIKTAAKPKPIIKLLVDAVYNKLLYCFKLKYTNYFRFKSGHEVEIKEKYSVKYDKETITVRIKKVSEKELGKYDISIKCIDKEERGRFGLDLVKEVAEEAMNETADREEVAKNQQNNESKNNKDNTSDKVKKKKSKDDEDSKKSKERRESKDSLRSDDSSKTKNKRDNADDKDKNGKKLKDDVVEKKSKNRRESKDSITSEDSNKKKKKKESGDDKSSKKSPETETEKGKEKKLNISKDFIISDDKKSKKDEVDGKEKKEKADKKQKKPVEPIFPPLIDTHLKNVKTTEDFQVKLVCKYSAESLPKLTWTKDGEDLIKSDRFMFKNRLGATSLTIEKTVLEDTGTYTLTLENEGGASESSCRVRIEEDEIKRSTKPVFESALQDGEIRKGYTYKFTASVSGTQKLEVEWFYNSRPIYVRLHFCLENINDFSVIFSVI